MRNMREVSIRIKLELIDEDPFSAEWIEEAVEDFLFLDQGEKVSQFTVEQPSIPIISVHPTRFDESDDIEAVKITPYGPAPCIVR